MEVPYFFPLLEKTSPKSISDDDLCSTCSQCQYKPTELSSCSVQWPGFVDPDGYVKNCDQFADEALVEKLSMEVVQQLSEYAHMASSEPVPDVVLRAYKALQPNVIRLINSKLPHVKHCPICAGKDIEEHLSWNAISVEDTDNTCKLTEYQCRTCDGRSFWA